MLCMIYIKKINKMGEERLDTMTKVITKLRSLAMVLMQRDDSLYQSAKVSFDENPEKLSPSPVIRRIAEKYVKEESRQKYLDVAARYEKCELSDSELEGECAHIIKFYRDWYSILLTEYAVNFTIGVLLQAVEIWKRMKKKNYPQNPSQFAIAEAIFGKNASYVLEHWTEIDSACSAYKVFEGEK